MTSNASIGKLFRKEDVTVLEWQIPQFSTLSYDLGILYRSPVFLFWDESCNLSFFPNAGQNAFEGYLLLLINCPSRYADILDPILCLKGVDGAEERAQITLFENFFYCHFCKRSEVINRSSVFLPNDVLTIQCTLKNKNQYTVPVSLLQRLQNLSLDMRKILKEKNGSDVVFKLKGQEIQAHGVILESRSKVIGSMLRFDATENKAGEVSIEDVEADVFQQILDYMYSAEVENLSNDTVFKLYVAADKYLLKEVKDLCKTFMERNMSVDTFCDVLAIADAYNETELMKLAKEFFTKHSIGILESEKWRMFLSENNAVAVQLLVSTVKESTRKSVLDHRRMSH